MLGLLNQFLEISHQYCENENCYFSKDSMHTMLSKCPSYYFKLILRFVVLSNLQVVSLEIFFLVSIYLNSVVFLNFVNLFGKIRLPLYGDWFLKLRQGPHEEFDGTTVILSDTTHFELLKTYTITFVLVKIIDIRKL